MEFEQRFFTFCFAIENISKNIQRYKNKRVASLNLRSTHVICLCQLYKAPQGMTVTELADQCHVNKSLISRVVTEIKNAGLIANADGEKGNYRKRLFLNDEGKKTAELFLHWVEEAVILTNGKTTSEELAVFYKVLASIDQNLERLVNEMEEK